MIDRTQLLTALSKEPSLLGNPLAEAARLLLDFPTDEQVEAAAKAFFLNDGNYTVKVWTALHKDTKDEWRVMARAALEAVTMIGDKT